MTDSKSVPRPSQPETRTPDPGTRPPGAAGGPGRSRIGLPESRVRLFLFSAVSAVVLGVYLYSVAPTAVFWDCSELIAVSYVLGIPHPPGAPLYVLIGRIFTLLPFGAEIAFRVNMFHVLCGVLGSGLAYLNIVQLISIYRERDRHPWLKHVAAIFGALMYAFAVSLWRNNLEAERYGPSAMIGLAVLYMALRWRLKVESGTGDNRLVLLAVFILFVTTGIHFMPMLVVFALLVFCLLVNREAIVHLRLFEFALGMLTLIAVVAMPSGGAETVVLKLFVAAAMLGATFFGVRLMARAESTAGVFGGLALVFVAAGIGFVASGGDMMDNGVLFLTAPLIAVIEMWVEAPFLLVLFLLLYAGYLYWLHTQGRLRLSYVGLMLGLVMVASTVHFFLLVRSGLGPPINEVDPSNWEAFIGVLRREQYDPMRLLPRKTQFLTENDYRMGTNPAFSLPVALFEQVKFYVRYLFWQWGGERYFDIFLGVRWQALLGLFPLFLGLWGMWHQFKNEKKSFVLVMLAFLVASLGLILYLNLKHSPSDPRPHLQHREVRERDYFYTFSFAFYAIFIGIGAHAFLRWVIDAVRNRKPVVWLTAGATVAYGFVPMFLNYPDATRRHNWIPAEFGYNMLISCPGDKTVLFTNGDNDTFPLWFMQEVPSRIADLDPEFGDNVAVANLSLLNTYWYCRQLREWGAPVSFTVEEIELLPQGFIGDEGRTFLLKDIMMRDIVATAGGVSLVWPDDYASPTADFQRKVFGPVVAEAEGWVRVLDLEPGVNLFDEPDGATVAWAEDSGLEPRVEVFDSVSVTQVDPETQERLPVKRERVQARQQLPPGSSLRVADGVRVAPGDTLADRVYTPKTPVYFATTVSTDNLRDFEGYLLLEGLVNRVVPHFGRNQINVERTHDLLFNVYRLNSTTNPAVWKDSNTRGLLINYAASYLALALEYQRLGRYRKAKDVLGHALVFDLDGQRRVPLYYHLARFAQLDGDHDLAIAAIDSIESLGFTDPELTMLRGLALQGKGEMEQAEREYIEAVRAAPHEPDPVQALYQFYLEDLRDTVRARQVLLDWLQRMPGDTVARRILERIQPD